MDSYQNLNIFHEFQIYFELNDENVVANMSFIQTLMC